MSTPQVNVSADVLQMLAPEAARLGIDLPTIARHAPEIDVTKNIRMVALELGRLLAPRNIFLRGGNVVTVDEETGEIKPMGAKRLPAWAEEYCTFRAPGARRVRDSLSVDDAAQILDTDTFKSCLRPLAAVHEMVLPVRRADGRTEWLAPGYDVESEIYTIERIKYDATWTLSRAQMFFVDVFGEFPWNPTEDHLKTKNLGLNRSFSLHVMNLVGQYCRAMFPAGTLFPIIGYFGNKPGTGKTRLAESAVSFIHGYAAAVGAPKDDDKMEVKLETIAQAMVPYVIFDDIGGGLRSNPLNRFTTESYHAGRKFHSNDQFFKVPNVTQVMVTANDLKTSEDIDRRALIVELFLDTEVRGRQFKRKITPQWLAADGTRADFLSACCAIVKTWAALEEGDAKRLHPSPLETYEPWTEIVAAMVMAAGFADPLKQREGVVGGAQDEDEIKQLLIAVANGLTCDGEITRQELVDVARKEGLLEDLVGTDGELDATANKRFGRRMQRWRGQKLKDDQGRMFEFSHKRHKTGARYPVTFIQAA